MRDPGTSQQWQSVSDGRLKIHVLTRAEVDEAKRDAEVKQWRATWGLR